MPEINGIATGVVLGTGAAINVSIGWIPDVVFVVNSDGDKVHLGTLGKRVAFTSGGTTEIVAGDKLRGATSVNSTAVVKQVIVTSGTWAGGDAAGWFIYGAEDAEGVFGSENVDLLRNGVLSLANAATVVAAVEHGLDMDTELAATTGNASITQYTGSAATAGRGFTMGSTISESGKLLTYLALRQN